MYISEKKRQGGLLTINTIFNHNIQLSYKIGIGEKKKSAEGKNRKKYIGTIKCYI